MSYQYLDDVATADVAFKAQGSTHEEMFISAAQAVMNVMVEDLSAIQSKEDRVISLKDKTLEMLLFQFLQEFIYYKDAEQLLLLTRDVHIELTAGVFLLTARASGEKINPKRHRLNVDVKAVTMHRFAVKQTPQGWEAAVVLDI